ncbi:unnamed protein product, partial [Effrenium voratum]
RGSSSGSRSLALPPLRSIGAKPPGAVARCRCAMPRRSPLAVFALAGGACFLLPQAPQAPARGAPKDAASSRRGLLGAAASVLAPLTASAFGDVKMPMSNIRYEEVRCDPDKG